MENNASRSGTSDLKLPSMIAENFAPSFSLKHMLKDTRLALALAQTHKLPLPLIESADRVFADGLEKKWGDEDFSVVAKNYDALLPPRPAPKPPEPAAPEASPDDAAVPPPAWTKDQPPTDEAAAAANGNGTDPTDKPAPIGGDPAHGQPKKGTLRVIRDFFNKPAQS